VKKIIFFGKKHTDDAKAKMKNSSLNKIWITNGVLNAKLYKEEEIPNGWYRGRTLKKSSTSSGKVWINNGQKEIYTYTDMIEDGWFKGRLKRTRH
jgi:hypothetical protein